MNDYIKYKFKNLIWQLFNYHNPGNKKDIVIFTTRRSGSTWITNIIYSQKGIKYLDQPLDLRLANRAQKKLLPYDEHSKFVCLRKKEKEQVLEYFNLIFKGKLKVRNPWNIFDENYDFITNRQVVKLCNGKSLIKAFSERFNVNIIFLIRHPISQSLSVMKRRWGYSPINAFLNNREFVKEYLNQDQVEFAKEILNSGTLLEKHVLNWVLQNIIPLKSDYSDNWITLSYEELVLRPKEIINILSQNLELNNKKAMYQKIATPSKTTYSKNKESKISSSREDRVNYLIKRWQDKCSQKEIVNINEILNKFQIDCYKASEVLPNSKYLLVE